TVIIVSHDREFLDGLVTKVYEFGNGMVKEHLGGIYDYLQAHNADTISEAISSPMEVSKETAPVQQEKEVASKQNYLEHKEQQKKLRKAERAVEDTEKMIVKLEDRIKELDNLLMEPKNASNIELVTEYTSIKVTLDKENNKWLLLSEALESLKEKIDI
ncbi:MAG: ABC transporter ATP-binding protein, partial [Bacteroidota bacterium]|nr:ABC transporter ATP-binding protein [Bacteroidota bacterium]